MPLFLDQAEQIAFVEALCAIASNTSNVEGVAAVQGLLAQNLQNLGFESSLRSNPDDRVVSGPLLVAEYKGQSREFVTLVSHADTLDGASVGRCRREASKLVGQGVLDDKASQVVAIAGLARFLRAHPRPRFSLRFVSSPSEEAGSTGFHEIFRALSRDSKVVLGFEPAMEDGSIIQSRRGNRWYDIEVAGREAHSGRAHRDGANAAVDLATKLVALQKLTNYKKDVTVSVASIEGGRGPHNVVCGHARAKVDTRFSTLKARDALHARLEKILARPRVRAASDRFATHTSWRIVDDCPPFSTDAAAKRLVGEYLSILGDLEGKPVRAVASGGAGDTCYLSRKGVTIIDGLGACGGAMHREDEFVEIGSIATRSAALAEFLGRLTQL